MEREDKVLSQLWEGFIPIQLCIAPTDQVSANLTESQFLMVSRYSYLSHAADDAIKYFQVRAIEISPEIWFECALTHVELKHHLPFGLLYDQHNHQYLKQGKYEQNELNPHYHQRPWKIYLHFQKPIARTPSNAMHFSDTQRIFFHTIKQSLHLLYGNANLFNALTIEQQTTLWQSTNSGNYLSYKSVLSSLSSVEFEMRHIPIRFITADDMNMRQKLIKPFQKVVAEDGLEKEIEKSLETVLQTELQLQQEKSEFQDNYSLVIQGICMSSSNWRNIPIKQFYYLMRHADLYLYILLVPKRIS